MVAAGYPLEAAQVPGGRKIGVQYQGPVQQGDAGVQIAAEVAKRMAASRERHRVVPAQFHCPPGQPGAFRRLSSDDRRVGKEGVSTGRSRRSQYHIKRKRSNTTSAICTFYVFNIPQ